MAQYYTDFSEYTTGETPSDWSKRWQANFTWLVEEDAGATGGKIVNGFTESSNDRNALTWDAIDSDPDRDEVEVFFICRFPDALGEAEILSLQRGSGEAGSETGYRHGPRPAQSAADVAQYVGGSFGGISSTDFDFVAGEWYSVRAQVFGTSHKLKVWLSSDPEPSTWNAEATNSDISGVGWVGLMRFRTDPIDVDVFSAGTNGDPAPTSEPTGGEVAEFSSSTIAGSSFMPLMNVPVKIDSSITANDQNTPIAKVSGAVVDSLNADDGSGEIADSRNKIEENLKAGTVEDSLSKASEAFSEALFAGEEWTEEVTKIIAFTSESSSTEDFYQVSAGVVERTLIDESSKTKSTFLNSLKAVAGVNEKLNTNDAFVLFVTLNQSIRDSINTSDDFRTIVDSKLSVHETTETNSTWGQRISILGMKINETLKATDFYQAFVTARETLNDDANAHGSFSYIFSTESKYMMFSSVTLSAALRTKKISFNTNMSLSRINIVTEINNPRIALDPKN